MNPYKNVAFFKIALRFSIIFLIVIIFIKIVLASMNVGFSGMLEKYFSSSTWMSFVRQQLIMSVIYGVFMAGYYKFIKK